MKITVIGTGYVGLVTGACFSKMGNKVYCVDIDEAKIDGLKNGILPIFEPHLGTMVKKGQEKGDLIFTTQIKEALDNTDIVGTCFKVKNHIQDILNDKGSSVKIDIASNPEFLKEGRAIEDCMHPDRIVIGAESEEVFDTLKDLYSSFVLNHDRFVLMDIKSSEMTKYVANAMLATKISFMNEIANICEVTGADVQQVRLGIGSDRRIGYDFIYAGCGYGGSCFPKDVQALINTAQSAGYEPMILSNVEKVNANQKMVLVNKVVDRFGTNLNGRTFGIWGLSFKPGTDDVREATSLTVITSLIDKGAKIKAYDPEAIEEFKRTIDEKYLDSIENVTD